jgi:PAS domain S-box-containing protein
MLVDPLTARVVEANTAACDFYGYAPFDLVGIELWRLSGWEPEGVLEVLQRAVQSPPGPLDIRHVLVAGKGRDVELYAGPIELEEGTYLYTISDDITERLRLEHLQAEEAMRVREAEKQLRASEARFRAAFSFAGVMMLVSRLSDGLIVDVNKAFLDQTGFRREQVIGRTSKELSFFVHPEDRDRMADLLRQDGAVRDFEVPIVTREGEVNHALFSAAVTQLDGEPHVILAVVNITLRKRAEETLRTSEERFRILVEQTVDGVLLLDGRPIDTIRGTRWMDYVDPEDLTELPLQLPPPGQGEPVEFERRLRRVDGSGVEVEVRARQFVPGLILGTAREMGSRKGAERPGARLKHRPGSG